MTCIDLDFELGGGGTIGVAFRFAGFEVLVNTVEGAFRGCACLHDALHSDEGVVEGFADDHVGFVAGVGGGIGVEERVFDAIEAAEALGGDGELADEFGFDAWGGEVIGDEGGVEVGELLGPYRDAVEDAEVQEAA